MLADYRVKILRGERSARSPERAALAPWKSAPRILLMLCAPTFLSAQAVTVAINKTAPDGSVASGNAAIRINQQCVAPGGLAVGDKTISVQFTGGAFSVSLVRNDTCVPLGTSTPGGTYYTVTWLLAGGRQTTERWVVGAGGATSVTLQPPFGPTSLPHLADGTYCATVAAGLVTVAAQSACGGGGGGLTWHSLTSSTWPTITSSAWAGITQ